MYNRYIRSDDGTYTRIPEEERRGTEQPPPAAPGPPTGAPRNGSPSGKPSGPQSGSSSSGGPQSGDSSSGGPGWSNGPRPSDGLTGFLRHLLDQFHMDHVDTGDMLLLVLLFFLFREEADEELLVALGLLLIL